MSYKELSEAQLANSVCQNCEIEMRQINSYLEQHFAITHFSYIKCLADGSHFGLNTHNEWLKHFYLNRYKEYDVFYHSIDAYVSGVFLWSCIKEQASFIGFREHSGIDHGITLVDKQPKSCEFYNFATRHANHAIINFYLNNLDILWRHTFYFKEKAAKLIKKAEKDRFILPRCNPKKEKSILILDSAQDTFRQQAVSTSPIKRYYLLSGNWDVYLTEPEARSCYYLLQSKSIKEIAQLMILSPRTVENHLAKIKIKLDCSTKSELVKKLKTETNLSKILDEISN